MRKVNMTVKTTLKETREEQGLMLHVELAKGNYGEDEFRLIQAANGAMFRMEFKGVCLDLCTEDLGKAMLDAIEAAIPEAAVAESEKTPD